MKIKVNKKDILNSSNKIVCVGYGDLQFLLRGQEALFYTCGVYGWNADVYKIDDYIIVTGYRPFGNMKFDYKKVEKLEKKARNIWRDYSLEYRQQVKKVNKLLEKALKTVAEV